MSHFQKGLHAHDSICIQALRRASALGLLPVDSGLVVPGMTEVWDDTVDDAREGAPDKATTGVPYPAAARGTGVTGPVPALTPAPPVAAAATPGV